MGMNLEGDGRIDGRFSIRKGQGLSQAIAGELGLNQEDCKKLGSIWQDIIKLCESQTAFKEGSYEHDQIMYEGDTFELSSATMQSIVNIVNEKLDKDIKVEKSDSVSGQTGETGVEAEEDVDDEVDFTEDQLPSVLARNAIIGTGLTVAMIIAAIKNPKFRENITPKLNPEQQAAFDEACKKLDAAKKAKVDAKSGLAKGVKDARKGSSDLKDIEALKKEQEAAQKALEKANSAYDKELQKLNKDPKYQEANKELKSIEKQIKKLEAQKAKNKSRKLSAKNEAKLQELKAQQAAKHAEVSKMETNLAKARLERQNANKALKDAQFNSKYEASEKAVEAANQAKADALKARNADPKYKEMTNKISKNSKRINELKAQQQADPSKFTKEMEKELSELEKMNASLKAKRAKLPSSKAYAKADNALITAKDEAKAMQKIAQNSEKAEKVAANLMKKGKKSIKVNMKKLPTSAVDKLRYAAKKGRIMGKAGTKALRGVGKGCVVLSAALVASDVYGAYKEGGAKRAGRQAMKSGTAWGTAAAAGWAGAKIGAAIGSFAGPVGTAVGGIVGGLIGGIAGWWAGEKAYDAVEKKVAPSSKPLNEKPSEAEPSIDSEDELAIQFESEDAAYEYLRNNPEVLQSIIDEHPELLEE